MSLVRDGLEYPALVGSVLLAIVVALVIGVVVWLADDDRTDACSDAGGVWVHGSKGDDSVCLDRGAVIELEDR